MRKEHRAGLIGFGAGSFFTLLVLSVLTGVGTFQTNLKTFWSIVALGGAVPSAVCLVIVAIEDEGQDEGDRPDDLPQPLDLVRDRYGDPGDQVAIAAGFSALTHPSSPQELTEMLKAVERFNYLPDPPPPSTAAPADYSLEISMDLGDDLPDPLPRPRLHGEDLSPGPAFTNPTPDFDPWADTSPGPEPVHRTVHVIEDWE